MVIEERSCIPSAITLPFWMADVKQARGKMMPELCYEIVAFFKSVPTGIPGTPRASAFFATFLPDEHDREFRAETRSLESSPCQSPKTTSV